jgi:hypothetical protein
MPTTTLHGQAVADDEGGKRPIARYQDKKQEADDAIDGEPADDRNTSKTPRRENN